MQSHDLAAAARGLRAFRVTREMTEEQAMDSMCPLGSLDQSLLGLVRFSGLTPWERHPEGDELLHVLEGVVEVTLLPATGPPQIQTVAAGSVCVVPRGLWHRQHASAMATLLFVTPTEQTANSWDDDPR